MSILNNTILEKLIEEDQIKQVFDIILEAELSPVKRNEANDLNRKFEEFKNDKNLGIISSSDRISRKSEIVKNLMDLINGLEVDEQSETKKSSLNKGDNKKSTFLGKINLEKLDPIITGIFGLITALVVIIIPKFIEVNEYTYNIEFEPDSVKKTISEENIALTVIYEKDRIRIEKVADPNSGFNFSLSSKHNLDYKILKNIISSDPTKVIIDSAVVGIQSITMYGKVKPPNNYKVIVEDQEVHKFILEQKIKLFGLIGEDTIEIQRDNENNLFLGTWGKLKGSLPIITNSNRIIVTESKLGAGDSIIKVSAELLIHENPTSDYKVLLDDPKRLDFILENHIKLNVKFKDKKDDIQRNSQNELFLRTNQDLSKIKEITSEKDSVSDSIINIESWEIKEGNKIILTSAFYNRVIGYIKNVNDTVVYKVSVDLNNGNYKAIKNESAVNEIGKFEFLFPKELMGKSYRVKVTNSKNKNLDNQIYFFMEGKEILIDNKN